MRLAVVGTSWITESFLKAVHYYPKIELTAIMSPKESSVKQFMDKYHFEKGYTDFDTMIKEGGFDFLYIASPNSFHFNQTKKALMNHINVLCEKPITLSLDELEELEKTVKENHVFFMEAMRVVHHPHTPIVKEAVEELDGLHYANLSFMRYSSKYDAYKKGENPRVFSKAYGGGALNDIGVYPLTLAVILFGVPQDIKVNSIILDQGIDATTSVSLNYGSFICDCNFSKVSNRYINNTIQGEKKALLLNHVTHLDELILVDETERKYLFNTRVIDDMRFELKAMMDMIINQDQQAFEKYLTITKDVTKICDDIRLQMNLREENETEI